MHFKDDAGRTLILRGVNLADGKFPLGQPTYHLESFDNAESCTYINTFFTLPNDPNPVTHNFQNGTIRGTTTSPSHVTDANTHLTRLAYLGFNILRIPVPWEALEHAGPGQYDDEYISYITRLVRLASSPPYNFRVIINPHQDLWSRHCGGSGAPLWTVHACGLDPKGFEETGACVRYAEWPLKHELQNVDGEDGEKADREKRPQDIPPMMWTTNHNRLATMTIFALFFAGREVAPKCRLRYKTSSTTATTNGTTTHNRTNPAASRQSGANEQQQQQDDDGYENIQDFLLRHYLAAYARLFAALGDLPFAYDSMNEPEPGYIGLMDLSTIERENTAKIGSTPTPIESMRLGMGMEQTVDEYRLGKTGPHKSGKITIRPERSCWLQREDGRWEFDRAPGWNSGECIWAQHGVWDVKSGELLVKDYFEKVLPYQSEAATREENEEEGRLSFVSSFWQEFHRRWTGEIRRYTKKVVVFLQPCVFEEPPPRDARDTRKDSGAGEKLPGDEEDDKIGYSPHYYDGLTVMHRHWHQSWNADVVGLLRGKHRTKITGLRVGQSNVRKAIASQLGILANDLPNVPTLIGEMGIPFNLDDGQAYRPKGKEGSGDYREHVKALDAMLSGCDEHLLSYTLWNYSPINSNQWGEHWNGEDLSIYSAGTESFKGHPQLEGFRASQAWCRPYVRSYDGEIIKMEFDAWKSEFEVEIKTGHGQEGKGGKAYAEVYVPWLHYAPDDGSERLSVVVQASNGTVWTREEPQLLKWAYGGHDGDKVKFRISRRSGPRSEKEMGTVLD